MSITQKAERKKEGREGEKVLIATSPTSGSVAAVTWCTKDQPLVHNRANHSSGYYVPQPNELHYATPNNIHKQRDALRFWAVLFFRHRTKTKTKQNKKPPLPTLSAQNSLRPTNPRGKKLRLTKLFYLRQNFLAQQSENDETSCRCGAHDKRGPRSGPPGFRGRYSEGA